MCVVPKPPLVHAKGEIVERKEIIELLHVHDFFVSGSVYVGWSCCRYYYYHYYYMLYLLSQPWLIGSAGCDPDSGSERRPAVGDGVCRQDRVTAP